MDNIPFNGRIAIIDDQPHQALPLINILSQHQRPLTYFTGEVKFLPKVGEATNDIRVLFLDINLIDDREHDDKVLKAKLVPVLNRVIAEDNFPYVIVYWSREDKKQKGSDKYKNLVDDIFSTDLKSKKPIGFLSADKIQFFNFDGTETDGFEELLAGLFEKINTMITTIPSYCYLLDWESKVHHSADKALQEIFCTAHTFEHWEDNVNYLISKMGASYAGINHYKTLTPEEQIRNSFQAFSSVFSDSLEYTITKEAIPEAKELKYNTELITSENLYTINRKLLISDELEPLDYTGAVTEHTDPKSFKIFDEVLLNVLNIRDVREQIKSQPGNENMTPTQLNRALKAQRATIRATFKRVYFVLTPLCDYIQKKNYNVKAVMGFLIKHDYLELLDNKSEAVFISPKFSYNSEIYILVLHFRYFFTIPSYKNIKNLNPLFRVRQQLFAEIQSKLARHVNRQGVLYLE